MSQPTQPHRAPTHTHSPINQSDNGQAPFSPAPASLQVARGEIYSQQTSHPQRMSEDLFLNIVLYIGSLLLIGAAALFISSVTSSTDETALIRVLALGLGAVVFYSAGLLTYRFVKRLRIASYSFTATGLAFIPLTGIATYILGIWDQGRFIWLTTSLVGTAAIIGACTLMRNRVMGYLLISFFISDSLAATRVVELPFVWYFIVLTVVAIVLGLVLHFVPEAVPRGIREGLVDSSRIFVPVTAASIFFFTHEVSSLDVGIAFTVMSVHAILFTCMEGKIDYFVQARIYPLIAVLAFADELNQIVWTPSIFAITVLVINLISAYVFVPRVRTMANAQRILQTQETTVSRIPWNSSADQLPREKFEWLPTYDAGFSLFFLFCAFVAAFATASPYVEGGWAELLPYVQTRHTVFPASWIIGILYLISCLAYRKALQPMALLILSALLPCTALLVNIVVGNTQGDFYLFFGASTIIYILSRRDIKLRFAGSMMSTLGYALGFFLLATTLFPDMQPIEMRLVFALVFALAGLLIFALPSTEAQGIPGLRRTPEGLAYLFLGSLSLLASMFVDITVKMIAQHFWAYFGMFSVALLLLTLLAILLLGRIFGISDRADMRYTLLVLTRIGLYGLLLIGLAGTLYYRGALATVITGTLDIAGYMLWVAVLPTLVTVLYAALGLTMLPHSAIRTEILTVSRLPICWSLLLLSMNNDVKTMVVHFFFVALMAAQTLYSILLYARSHRIAELYIATGVFTVAACYSAFTGGLLYLEDPLLSVGAPALLIAVWGVGVALKVPYLQLGASLNVCTFCVTALWNVSGVPDPSDRAVFFGYSALLAVVILWVLKILLPREIFALRSNVRPSIVVQAGSRNVVLPMHGPLPSPSPQFAPRLPLAQGIFGPSNYLLMVPALVVLYFATLMGLLSPSHPELNALLWGLSTLCLISACRVQQVPTIATTAFCLSISRLMLHYSDAPRVILVLEIALLIVLAIAAVGVFKNLAARRPANEQVSSTLLYCALGLQALLTLVLWRIPTGGPDVILLVLGIGLTLLAGLVLPKAWAYVSAVLVTVDLAISLNGLNPLFLLIISVVLIAGVIWRLLARQGGRPDDSGIPPAPVEQAPVSQAVALPPAEGYIGRPSSWQAPQSVNNQPNPPAQTPLPGGSYSAPEGNGRSA